MNIARILPQHCCNIATILLQCSMLYGILRDVSCQSRLVTYSFLYRYTWVSPSRESGEARRGPVDLSTNRGGPCLLRRDCFNVLRSPSRLVVVIRRSTMIYVFVFSFFFSSSFQFCARETIRVRAINNNGIISATMKIIQHGVISIAGISIEKFGHCPTNEILSCRRKSSRVASNNIV